MKSNFNDLHLFDDKQIQQRMKLMWNCMLSGNQNHANCICDMQLPKCVYFVKIWNTELVAFIYFLLYFETIPFAFSSYLCWMHVEEAEKLFTSIRQYTKSFLRFNVELNHDKSVREQSQQESLHKTRGGYWAPDTEHWTLPLPMFTKNKFN